MMSFRVPMTANSLNSSINKLGPYFQVLRHLKPGPSGTRSPSPPLAVRLYIYRRGFTFDFNVPLSSYKINQKVDCVSSGRQTSLQNNTHLFQLLFCLEVMLLQTDSFPVDLGCLDALGGHGGISETNKDGVMGAASAIQTNKTLLVGAL